MCGIDSMLALKYAAYAPYISGKFRAAVMQLLDRYRPNFFDG